MHKNAIALSSDQATFLKTDKSFLAAKAARFGFEPVARPNVAPEHGDRLESNQNYDPNESYRRQAANERIEHVCNNEENRQGKLYEIRKFVSEINDNEENKGGNGARKLSRAASGSTRLDQDQDHLEKQQNRNPNQQLLALTRFNPIKMELTNQQEQVASSKQQQQRVQHESVVELLDTTSQTNVGRMSSKTTTTTTTTTTATTATATQGDTISSIQNETHSIIEQKTSAFCAGCQAQIKDKFIFSVIDLYWHQDCVQCADCSLKLNDRCYTLNGKLYCKHDYWHRFGPKCFACQQSIEQSELVQRIKGNRVYHLKCFTCHECQRPLKQGEQLHLVGDKRLLCKQDFQKLNDYRLVSSGGDGGNGGSNTGGQSKQDPTSNNNGSSSNSSSYLTLLGGGNSIKNSSSGETGDGSNGNGQQKRSSLTSLDNMTLGTTTELACQRTNTNGELQDQEIDEAEMDDDDNDNHVLALDGNRRVSSIGFDTEMLIDDDDDQDQFNEDEENLVGRQRHSIMSSGDVERQADEQLEANCSVKPVNKQQQKHSINTLSNGAGTRKKRRRKQRLSIANNDKQQTAGKQQISQTKPDTKMMGARNGESILNGSATSSAQHQQPASILAGMHSVLDGNVTNNKQQHKSSCSSSSSSSSSSNHSSSNSSTMTNSHHHDHHHQQGSGAAHRLGSAAASVNHHHNHHNHHHHSSGGNHQSQQSTGGGGGGHKPTRVRTVLNEKQLQTLRDCYAQNPRPDALMKEQLVDMTGLSPRVIRVWFQNKRCKDKKKSILYKQMQQHEKDGRHLTGLTHIRGVPMVAASPIHYQDDHSMGATNTPMSGAAGTGTGSADPGSPQSQQQQQQQQQHQRQSATVQSPPQSNQPIDIHAYQPPWKGLVEYAQQAGPGAPQQPDRLNASSPRYVQLIGQIHGYGNSTATTCDHQVGGELNPAQQQQQQQFGSNQAPANAYPQAPPPPQQQQQQQQQQQPPPPHHIQLQHQQQLHHQLHQQQPLQHHPHHHQTNHHLHHNHHHLQHQPQQQAHLAQVVSPMAGHHAGQFQH